MASMLVMLFCACITGATPAIGAATGRLFGMSSNATLVGEYETIWLLAYTVLYLPFACNKTRNKHI